MGFVHIVYETTAPHIYTGFEGGMHLRNTVGTTWKGGGALPYLKVVGNFDGIDPLFLYFPIMLTPFFTHNPILLTHTLWRKKVVSITFSFRDNLT